MRTRTSQQLARLVVAAKHPAHFETTTTYSTIAHHQPWCKFGQLQLTHIYIYIKISYFCHGGFAVITPSSPPRSVLAAPRSRGLGAGRVPIHHRCLHYCVCARGLASVLYERVMVTCINSVWKFSLYVGFDKIVTYASGNFNFGF
jgi:hypothetical protein